MSNLSYILLVALVTYLLRALPLTLIRKPIRSRFIRSFLYYVPYVTLAVMTFPAMVQSTTVPLAGAIAMGAAVALALLGQKLLTVSVAACAVVFVLELFMV